MNVINILLIGTVLIFTVVSIIIFFKRYKDNKEKLSRISKENGHELQKSLEEEVRKKREEEIKKLEAGDQNTIIEVLDRLFKSSKLAGWVRSNNFHVHNSKSISIIAHISGQEELVKTKKEITLKTGEVYTQNKHYLAVKKEYSEKVFQCAYKIIEETFTNIPTLYKLYISEYIAVEEKENPVCVLSMSVNKDQYRSVKDKNSNSIVEKIDMFNAKYNYDSKNYEFQEIEPVETPAGENSLEKTMAAKASANTSFYGSTILTPNSEPVNLKKEHDKPDNINLGSETKISNLSGSMMFDRDSLNIKDFDPPVPAPEDEDNFDLLVENFMKKSKFTIISENTSDDEVSIMAIGPSKETFLINISKSNKNIKEENIKTLVSNIISKNIINGIYISKGGFALDSVQYAAINSIELFDKEKLKKL